jgi:hypothetical protein
MKHEVKKISQITNEIISMLLLDGAEDIEVAIKRDQEATYIDLIQRKCHYEPSFIEKLNDELNIPRQHEIEGYYWQLAGENECENELCLVAAMTDTAEVDYSDGELKIHLVRKAE